MAGPGVELATAWVRLVPSMEGVTGQVARELGAVDTSRVGRGIGGQFATNIGQGIRAAATGTVATAAGLLGTALVRGLGRLNALDQARAKLTGLGNDAAAVDAIMANALASVRGTAFGMDAAATVAASAVAAGIQPGQELERTLSLVADAATIAGTDMGSMGAIFNKVAASNKVQMDVINQLHDAGVPALASLADYMGVTAEEASRMASRGEIDFATFQAAMESTLGGAAASSGDTFSGAMANVGASLGRVGAGILGGIFPKLAPLFQGITSALGPVEDRAAALGEVIGQRVAPVVDWLTNALQNGIGELRIAPQIIAPLTGAFVALGSSGLAPLLRMVPGLGGFAARLGMLGGPAGLAIAAFVGLVAVSPELQAALGGLLAAVTEAAVALAPSLSEVSATLGGALVSAMQIAVPIVAGIADALSWLLADVIAPNAQLFTTLAVGIGLVVAAFKVWQITTAAFIAVQTAWNAAQAIGAAVTGTFTAAKAAGLTTTTALAAATSAGAAATTGDTAAKVANRIATITGTAAMIGQRVAMIAGSVATGIATAAQWALNAAMSANPIALVVIAIAALVAALIWFFTQTELGQEIWSNFVQFLQEAWANIVAFATDTWNNLAAFFTGLWESIVAIAQGAWSGFTGWLTSAGDAIASWWNGLWQGVGDFFTGLWQGITSAVTMIIRGWIALVMSIVGAVASWWNGLWSGIGSFFSDLWSSIVSGVTQRIQAIASVIRNVVGGIASWWRSTWSAVSSFFSNLWSGIVSTVQGVGRAFGNVFNGIKTAAGNAFRGLVSVIKGPINGVIGLVNGAIRALNRVRVNIPSWVPVIGGQTFGVNLPTIPRLAEGATVLPRAGGTLAVLAEAGRPESVVDTGLMNRALEQGLAGENGGGTVVQGPLVHIGEVRVDSEERVEQLAQALHERAERAKRARGKVNLEGAVA